MNAEQGPLDAEHTDDTTLGREPEFENTEEDFFRPPNWTRVEKERGSRYGPAPIPDEIGPDGEIIYFKSN